jgi:hypothetical protein
MKSFKNFVSETVKSKPSDSNDLRIKSLTTQKNHIDDVIKQTRKRQTLQKAYKMISDVNRAPNTKKVKNVK